MYVLTELLLMYLQSTVYVCLQSSVCLCTQHVLYVLYIHAREHPPKLALVAPILKLSKTSFTISS